MSTTIDGPLGELFSIAASFVAGGVLATAAIEWWFFLAGRRTEAGR